MYIVLHSSSKSCALVPDSRHPGCCFSRGGMLQPRKFAPVRRYTSGKRTRHGLPVGSAPVTGDESGDYGE